ncbi:nSTAND1 domain-containing NTPase, partial [Actinoplanes philippinensis]|uniref:nSTAND1 domain-containing NTPase n=1 Tax=Actinoplanes philippinensis TaxID=35752 RepID=UPI0033FC9F2E
MPREERPLESEDTPLLQLAGDLRRLRLGSGRLSYRELGRRTNYSAAALSDALSGRRLPSLAITLAVATACGGDAGEWTERWRRVAAGQRGASAGAPVPYAGLAAYGIGDADRFFGREAVTGTLTALVGERPFVGVFGPSGAGKSSLLRAGLIARSERTTILVTPGADPVTELAATVAHLADEPVDRVRGDLAAGPEALRGWLAKAADDVLLVVDQFEEVFTLCGEAGRLWLIRALTAAAGPRARVVIGVRADFYGHCARHPELVTALHRAQVLVGPMSTEELRSAITEPAVRAGATIETALVARVIADVAGQPRPAAGGTAGGWARPAPRRAGAPGRHAPGSAS